MRKGSTGTSRAPVFMFVPAMQNLPIRGVVTNLERSGELKGQQEKNAAAPKEMAREGVTADGQIFKAEIVYIKGSEEVGVDEAVREQTELQCKHPVDQSLHQMTSVFGVQAGNTPNQITSNPFFALPTAKVTEATAVNTHNNMTQQQCHNLPLGTDFGSGYLVNRASTSEDPTDAADFADPCPTLASSRESIFSDFSWDKEKTWAAKQLSNGASSVSVSRTVSPCSSVRSGMFSPAVLKVTRHSLAPGSTLLNMPSTCLSSCESLSSSVCPQSPPPSRHRPPLTRLSLLTAILRKGRLPILSSALQRPYSPCWPINQVSLASCKACSAASSLAVIPSEIGSAPKVASSSTCTEKHHSKDFHKCKSAPAPMQLKGIYSLGSPTIIHSSQTVSNVEPKWVYYSPPSPGSENLPRPASCNDTQRHIPLPHKYSTISDPKPFDPVSMNKGFEMKKVQSPQSFKHSFSSSLESPEMKSRKIVTDLESHEGADSRCSPLPKFRSVPAKPIIGREAFALHEDLPKLSSPNSSIVSFPPKPSFTLSYVNQTQPSMVYSSNSRISSLKRAKDKTVTPQSPVENFRRNETPLDCEGKMQSAEAPCLPPPTHAPLLSSGWSSPSNSPLPPHVDRLTLTPSPVSMSRSLTASPSLSIRSTPSPKPWLDISDCINREGKRRKIHKIKLNYKSLAAIPTNTLLMDQQKIDDRVEEGDPHEKLDSDETHAEMCSPAQLRQQSEDLYATIDEVLEDCIQEYQTSCLAHPSRKEANKASPKHNPLLPRSLGRETKYASYTLPPHASGEEPAESSERTKPGVIRPLTASPWLAGEDDVEVSHANPFRQYLELGPSENKMVRPVRHETA